MFLGWLRHVFGMIMTCFWDDPSMILGCFWHVSKMFYRYFGMNFGMFRETLFLPKTRVTLLLHSFLHGRYTTISTTNPIEHRSHSKAIVYTVFNGLIPNRQTPKKVPEIHVNKRHKKSYENTHCKHKMKCIQIENEVKTINTMRHQTIDKWKGTAAAAGPPGPRGPKPCRCRRPLSFVYGLKSHYIDRLILIFHLTCKILSKKPNISFDSL